MGCGSSSTANVASRSVINEGRRVSGSGSSTSSSSRSSTSGAVHEKHTDNNENRADLDETGLEDGLVIPPSYDPKDQKKEEESRVNTEELPKEEDAEPKPAPCEEDVVPPKEEDIVPVPVPDGDEPVPEPPKGEGGEPDPTPDEKDPEPPKEEDVVPIPVPVRDDLEPEPPKEDGEPEPEPPKEDGEPEPPKEDEEPEPPKEDGEPEPPKEDGEPEPPKEDGEPEPEPPKEDGEPDVIPCEEDPVLLNVVPVPVPVVDEQKPESPKEEADGEQEHALETVLVGDYVDVGLGVKEKICDFRSVKDKPDVVPRPQGSASDPYTDHEFNLKTAIPPDCVADLEWKRPQEFAEKPELFTEGTTRFDIGQGAAGTCWFLSMVANMSERPELLSRVIPQGAYPSPGSPEYDGVFHCKFWRFGEWVDVYIDDFLPIIYGEKPWGARSSTDRNEMWVSLLEKAFAHLHGSYTSVYGGQPGDAFLALTGGVSERIDFEEDDIKDMEIFQRIQNALGSECLITCVVPDKYDDVKGLVGGHAYSLNDTCKVQDNSGEMVHLMRVRNPWGHTEWKGAWSDGSEQWQTVPPGAVANPNKDDGEFWICLRDFLVYFSQTTICSLMPDFDSDGCADALDHKTCIFGEWKGETASGFHKRLSSPKFSFTIPEDAMMEDGTVPVVIQSIQKMDDRKDEKVSHRVDLYKVLGQRESPKSMYIMQILGKKTNLYMREKQISCRHCVEPGQYVVIPSTLKEGDESEFLLRIFTPTAVSEIREVKNSAIIHSSDDIEEGFSKRWTYTGEWKTGVNAGGQVMHQKTFHTNPQYKITVPDNGSTQDVQFVVMQDQAQSGMPIGIRLFTLDSDVEMPVDSDYLYQHYETSPANTEGGQNKFVISSSVDTKYSLNPGEYILLLHLDTPEQEQVYSLIVQSNARLDIKEYNIV